MKIWMTGGCLLLVLAGYATAVAENRKSKEIKVLISDESSKLEQLKERISKQDKAISNVGSKEVSSLRTLRRLDDRLKLTERELRIYQWNQQVNEKKIGELTAKIKVARAQLKKQRHILSARLRSIYKEGSMFPVKVLFSATDVNPRWRSLHSLGSS